MKWPAYHGFHDNRFEDSQSEIFGVIIHPVIMDEISAIQITW